MPRPKSWTVYEDPDSGELYLRYVDVRVSGGPKKRVWRIVPLNPKRRDDWRLEVEK